MATLPKLKWDVLPHPAYSPDLAPSDYHSFGQMKGLLGGKRFQNKWRGHCRCAMWIQEPSKTFETRIKSYQRVGPSALQSTGTTLKSV
ncbi:hypothetical protein Cfor_06662 [Coptotermes formosanus]|uniref:Tc1-like transposase DDE domain-containing protein n=1 Tax=Coptotermes formosanus TaxID=36987 RepID=A0A6L2QC02_COPFO|nr:hypothetical protein Cfor_06662 [Coptotermes formosanus]